MNITLCNIDYDLTQFLYLEKELVILYILYKEGKYIMLDEKFMGRVTAMYKYQRETENLTSDEAASKVLFWVIDEQSKFGRRINDEEDEEIKKAIEKTEQQIMKARNKS